MNTERLSKEKENGKREGNLKVFIPIIFHSYNLTVKEQNGYL